jgi:hypothetical protein
MKREFNETTGTRMSGNSPSPLIMGTGKSLHLGQSEIGSPLIKPNFKNSFSKNAPNDASPGLGKSFGRVTEKSGIDSEAEDSVESLIDVKPKIKKLDFQYSDIRKKLDRTASVEQLVLDLPLYRDRKANLKQMETVFGSIMMGCAMG